MNISDKYKLIFFHLPKCAGKSITSVLDIKTNDKTNLLARLRLKYFEINPAKPGNLHAMRRDDWYRNINWQSCPKISLYN